MKTFKFLSLLVLMSCASQQDKIVIPTVGSDFYSQALLKIDDDLEGDEDNLHLVEQKLYYCDYLDWPQTCIEALDEFKRQKGMTPQLLQQYANYYLEHEQYADLLNVMNRWAVEFEFNPEYLKYQILATSKLQLVDESTELLRNYMIGKKGLQDIEFAASRYIELQDTAMASYYLGKLNELDADNNLIFENYSLMLYSLGYLDKAFEIMEEYSRRNEEDFEFHYDLASRYESAEYYVKARQALGRWSDVDSITYQLADLYIAENQWDSAHLQIDRLIAQDSLDRNAWTKKAMMYEDRGWLNYSLNYFNHVLYLYPEDSIARHRALIVQRKIAYLQRKKFEENQLPLPVIKSKKITN